MDGVSSREQAVGNFMTEVEAKFVVGLGPSHRHARSGQGFARTSIRSPRNSPDAPLTLLASSMRIETAAVPRPGSMRPHWTMPHHPRYVHHLACPIRPSIQLHTSADCLALARCALVLELLVVKIAGVGAGHVVPVPTLRCLHVRSCTPRQYRWTFPASYQENRFNRTRRRCPWRTQDL